MRFNEWSGESGVSSSTFERNVKKLIESGVVRKDGDRYLVTGEGIQVYGLIRDVTPIHPHTPPVDMNRGEDVTTITPTLYGVGVNGGNPESSTREEKAELNYGSAPPRAALPQYEWLGNEWESDANVAIEVHESRIS